MKIILLIAGFFLTAFISYGQSDTALKYSEVISIDSVSKDALFQKARSWLNDAFKSSKDVIQIQDKETGELIGKGVMSVISTYHYFGKHNYEQNCTFNIQIIAKDGKFKYTFSNIVETSGFGLLTSAKDCPNPPTLRKIANEVWTTTKDEVDIKMRTLAISLKEAMVKKSTLDF